MRLETGIDRSIRLVDRVRRADAMRRRVTMACLLLLMVADAIAIFKILEAL